MKFISKYLSFRSQIIVVVVALSTIPLFLFGINAYHLAGQSYKSTDEIKNNLVINVSHKVENYFLQLNKSLSFTVPLEKRNLTDLSMINKILYNVLETHEKIAGIGYIKGEEVLTYIGEDIKVPPLKERVKILLSKFEKDERICISDSYNYKDNVLFDLVYPMEGGKFIYLTLTLKEIEKELQSNSIGYTGKFVIIKGNGRFFAGDSSLMRVMSFLKIEEITGVDQEGIVVTEKRGYQLKAKKIEGVIWPLWVVFIQKVAEAKLLTIRLKSGVIVILLVMLFLSGWVSFILSRNFSRPIANLLYAVKKNFEGNLNTKAVLDKESSGELAFLIKEFNQMIDTLKKTREELVKKEKLATVGEMASIITHDIRNPLAAIKNGVFYLKTSPKIIDERLKEVLEIIDREITNINEIINDLLGFSRQKPPSLSPVDVNSLIEETISIIDKSENVEIIKEFDEELPKYQLDRGEIRQVLVNLIKNAVQACDKKQGAIKEKLSEINVSSDTIRAYDKKQGVVKVITGREKDGRLGLRILDNGIGIRDEDKDNIFKPFYSTKAGGTGLGLASVKRIIERHNGVVDVDSTYGKGTEFKILIPG